MPDNPRSTARKETGNRGTEANVGSARTARANIVSYDRQAAVGYASEYWTRVCSDGFIACNRRKIPHYFERVPLDAVFVRPGLGGTQEDARVRSGRLHAFHFLLHRNAASQGHEGGRPSNSGCTRAWHTQFSSLWDHFRACPRQVSDRSWRYRRLQKQGELGGISHGAPSRRGHSSLSHKLPHGSPLE